MGMDELPPWQPIADWLAEKPNFPCDEEHEEIRLRAPATANEVRNRYKKSAKAIAYDIATYNEED